MKRLNMSALFLACLLVLVFEDSSPEQTFHRGPNDSRANFVKHPRVFLDVSPIAIKRVLDAMYCALQCLRDARCLSYNCKVKRNEEGTFDCQLLATDKYSAPHLLKSSKEFDYYTILSPCDTPRCQNGGTCRPTNENQGFKCDCTASFTGTHCEQVFRGESCEDIVRKAPAEPDGVYEIFAGKTPQTVYCDMTNDRKGWTLIARFSNQDGKLWMQNDGRMWYTQATPIGQTTNPGHIQADMLSPAFWLVSGTEFKITRSDDSSHTALLSTAGGCLGGQTFRSKITSYGDFRALSTTVWASDECLGSCEVRYGGRYKDTVGFQGAECNGTIQQWNKIGFWCDYGAGDGAVMTIGGAGGSGKCQGAAHGVGVTEADEASFSLRHNGAVFPNETEYDFGNSANSGHFVMPFYNLNLWIR